MKIYWRAILVFCVAVLPLAPASAENKWAIGGSLSIVPLTSSNGVGFGDLCDRFESTRCTANNIGGKLYLTYDANPYVTLELSWIHLEQDKEHISDTEFSVTGPALAVMPMLSLYTETPESGLDFFPKIGVYSWDFSGTTGDSSGRRRFGITGTDRFIGLGVRIRIDSISARIELEQFEIDDNDVIFFSGGLSYRF